MAEELSSYLSARGAEEAEDTLRNAGIERVEDLEPLLNAEDLNAIGLHKRLSGLLLGDADMASHTNEAEEAAAPAPPPPMSRRRSSTGSDLAGWLAAHDLSEAEEVLEAMGILRLADLQQLSPDDVVHLELPEDLLRRMQLAIDATGHSTANADSRSPTGPIGPNFKY